MDLQYYRKHTISPKIWKAWETYLVTKPTVPPAGAEGEKNYIPTIKAKSHLANLDTNKTGCNPDNKSFNS